MSDSRPWLALWYRAFWGSPRVRKMPMEAAGLYLKLLCDEWEEGGPITSDEDVWRTSYGHLCAFWEKSWALVRTCFDDVAGGRMANDRLEREREVADDIQAKKSAAGKLANEIRWGRAKKAASRPSRIPDGSDCYPNSSNKDRDSTETRQDKTEEGEPERGATPSDPPSPPRRRSSNPEWDGEIPDEVYTEALGEAVADFEEHRKEIRKPITPKAGEALCRQFTEWGEKRSIAALRHTIRNGWQGLREPDLPKPWESGRAGGSDDETNRLRQKILDGLKSE